MSSWRWQCKFQSQPFLPRSWSQDITQSLKDKFCDTDLWTAQGIYCSRKIPGHSSGERARLGMWHKLALWQKHSRQWTTSFDLNFQQVTWTQIPTQKGGANPLEIQWAIWDDGGKNPLGHQRRQMKRERNPERFQNNYQGPLPLANYKSTETRLQIIETKVSPSK